MVAAHVNEMLEFATDRGHPWGHPGAVGAPGVPPWGVPGDDPQNHLGETNVDERVEI